MTTPIPPDPPTTPAAAASPAPRRGWRRLRPRGRGGVIGAAVVALLVVGGVAAALLIPDGDGRGHRGGSGVGLAGESGELGGPDGLNGLNGLGGLGGADDLGGPASGRGEGRDRGGRGGDGARGLGADTLLAGTVVSTSAGSIVVTPDGGAQRTVRTDDNTRVRGNDNQALGDLQTGERVVIRVSGTGDAATVVTILAPQARVTGTVTALSGDTATITAVDGLGVTANVAALSQKPAVGDLVVLTGVAANGTTITADGIRVLPKAS
jgi:hypothetical protein